MKRQIAVIGLGTMGSSLALNFADHGYSVHTFNRTYSKAENLKKENPEIHIYSTLAELIKHLEQPRVLFLMVPAGKVVDLFMKDLEQLVGPDDIVIDGGNSDYQDTIRRSNELKYHVVGCGISGGEYGARNGPSMMVGCKRKIYDRIKDIFTDISSRHHDKPCCGWLGEDGAGHFVKIVHNAIEYAEMQLLQEVYNITSAQECSNASNGHQGANNDNIFEEWNRNETESYLVGVCSIAMKRRHKGSRYLDQILDKAEQKGTGKMGVIASVELGSHTTSLTDAVLARFVSHDKESRVQFSKAFQSSVPNDGKSHFDGKGNAVDPEKLRRAFYLCKAVSYIQGFHLLKEMAQKHSWAYSVRDICDIWRNGCILRSGFLDVFKDIAEELECSEAFLKILGENYEALVATVAWCVKEGKYVPVHTSCLMWINGMKMAKKNGNLIQAMRDYFGRHGVVLESGETVNIDWD